MVTGIKEKQERWKLLAEQYLKDDVEIFCKDFDDDIYFGKVLLVGDRTLTIECTGPAHRAGQNFNLEWLRLIKFEVAN